MSVVEFVGSPVGSKSVCEGIRAKLNDIGNASSRIKVKEMGCCGKDAMAKSARTECDDKKARNATRCELMAPTPKLASRTT